MTEITQADRDAAAEAFFCKPLLNEKHNDDRRVRAFARHRQYGYDQGYYDGRQADGAEERANGRIEALQADNARLRAALAPFVDFWEWDTIKTFMDYPVSQCFTPATFLRAVKTFHETSETFTRSDDT